MYWHPLLNNKWDLENTRCPLRLQADPALLASKSVRPCVFHLFAISFGINQVVENIPVL